MGLRFKFNLILLAVFVAGFLSLGMAATRYLQSRAMDDARHAAQLVLDMVSFGNLDPRIAMGLGSRLADIRIREFKPDDVLTGIEAQAALRMRTARDGQFTEAMTTSAGERRLVVARSIRPPEGGSMVRAVIVDLAPILTNVNIALTTLLSSIGAVFFAVFVVLNLMLDRMIVRPVAEMARQADAVSIGDFAIPEFLPRTADEIGMLGTAFNRMRRSTEEAIKLLKNSAF